LIFHQEHPFFNWLQLYKRKEKFQCSSNAAGVSPSQASIEQILKVDLYGTAVLLEEFGKVIKVGGTGVTISSQSGHRMPALNPETDRQLATTPSEELLNWKC